MKNDLVLKKHPFFVNEKENWHFVIINAPGLAEK